MTLNIPLPENYCIKSDSRQFILAKVGATDREGVVGFFSTLESTLNYYIQLQIREFNDTSVLGLLSSIKMLQTALNNALHPLKLVVSEKSGKLIVEGGG